MFRATRLLVAMVFFLVVYVGVVAPALERVSSQLSGLTPNAGVDPGVIGTTETVIFLGMPLLFLGGIILLVALIAVGIRGTSFNA
jgi:hypothetical protein